MESVHLSRSQKNLGKDSSSSLDLCYDLRTRYTFKTQVHNQDFLRSLFDQTQVQGLKKTPYRVPCLFYHR